MQIMREDVFEKVSQHHDALRDLGVRELQLFGSAVRNEARDGSDLDFIVDL